MDFPNKWIDGRFVFIGEKLKVLHDQTLFARKRRIRARLGFVRTDQVCMSVLGIGIHGHLGRAQMLTPSHQDQQLWMFVMI